MATKGIAEYKKPMQPKCVGFFIIFVLHQFDKSAMQECNVITELM